MRMDMGSTDENRKEDEEKSTYDPTGSTASNVIHNFIYVEGDLKGDIIKTEGGDVYKSVSINSFKELKEFIRADDLLSDYGKHIQIEHVEIIEKELENSQPDIGRIKRAYEWLERNAPRIVEGVLIRLIPRLIMYKITAQ